MIGAPYEQALAGHPQAEAAGAPADGGRTWPAGDRTGLRPGDDSLIERCAGPTLDVGSGPGRLTTALGEHGIPALGIDVTPYAVRMTRASGALTLLRDVFGRVPGTGRWMTVLLADGNIGIGGDPVALLRRIAELLAPLGQALIEVQRPGAELRRERVRLRPRAQPGDWITWAYVGVDQVAGIAAEAGLSTAETWCCDDRWFMTLRRLDPAG